MNSFLGSLGTVFCTLAAVAVLKETRKEWIPYVLLTLCIFVLFSVSPLWEKVVDWMYTIDNEGTYGKVLIKAAGIAILTELSCEICKSLGENTIAGYTALIGKAEIFWISLPLFEKLVKMALEIT